MAVARLATRLGGRRRETTCVKPRRRPSRGAGSRPARCSTGCGAEPRLADLSFTSRTGAHPPSRAAPASGAARGRGANMNKGFLIVLLVVAALGGLAALL